MAIVCEGIVGQGPLPITLTDDVRSSTPDESVAIVLQVYYYNQTTMGNTVQDEPGRMGIYYRTGGYGFDNHWHSLNIEGGGAQYATQKAWLGIIIAELAAGSEITISDMNLTPLSVLQNSATYAVARVFTGVKATPTLDQNLAYSAIVGQPNAYTTDATTNHGDPASNGALVLGSITGASDTGLLIAEAFVGNITGYVNTTACGSYSDTFFLEDQASEVDPGAPSWDFIDDGILITTTDTNYGGGVGNSDFSIKTSAALGYLITDSASLDTQWAAPNLGSGIPSSTPACVTHPRSLFGKDTICAGIAYGDGGPPACLSNVVGTITLDPATAIGTSPDPPSPDPGLFGKITVSPL